MNTPINFEIAKLLKEKGYRENLPKAVFKNEGSLRRIYNGRHGMFKDEYCAPTIAEVVMWLYEEHDILVSIFPVSLSRHKLLERSFNVSIFTFSININVQTELLRREGKLLSFMSPTEAYLSAINYTLNNLL